MRVQLNILYAIAGIFFLSSCATIFNEFQGAKTVGKDNYEITPTVSAVSFRQDNESTYTQTNAGFQLAYGLTETVDFRVRYEMIFPDVDDVNIGDFNVLGIAPKVAIIPDKLAYYMPIGFAFGKDIETKDTFEVQPTLLFTQTLSDQFDINLSGKYIVPLRDESENLVAFNMSFGILGEPIKIRPAAGILFNPGEEGIFIDLGLGVSIPF